MTDVPDALVERMAEAMHRTVCGEDEMAEYCCWGPEGNGDTCEETDLRPQARLWLAAVWPDLPAARPERRTYDHRDNAGEWVHDDGSPCPEHWSDRPSAPSGESWWCTTHQQHVHVRAAARPVVDRDALAMAIHSRAHPKHGAGYVCATGAHTVDYRIADAILASGVVQDAADGRRVVAEAAILAAADEMEAVIAEGDVAEVAAPVSGEVNRSKVVAKRDALYEEPAKWLRDNAAPLARATEATP